MSPAKKVFEGGVEAMYASDLVALDDGAVDDSEDLDDDFVNVQKTMNDVRRGMSIAKGDNRIQDMLPFHFSPNCRPLTVSDLDSCDALEQAAFSDPKYRCSREKLEYRLSVCPELSLGLFCTVIPSFAEKHEFEISTLPVAKAVEGGRDDGAVSVLLAHIIATKFDATSVSDKDMEYPCDFKTVKNSASGVGHLDAGRTVALHSIAVHPKLHGCGLGKLIMKAYMQQMKGSGIADRISLIAQEDLVNYFVKYGYQHVGPSEVTFAGGGWRDLTMEIGGAPNKA